MLQKKRITKVLALLSMLVVFNAQMVACAGAPDETLGPSGGEPTGGSGGSPSSSHAGSEASTNGTSDDVSSDADVSMDDSVFEQAQQFNSKSGTMDVSAPSEIVVGSSATIDVFIIRLPKEKGRLAPLSQSANATNTDWPRSIAASTYMRVELTALEGIFELQPLTAPTQHVVLNDATRWRWIVKPLRPTESPTATTRLSLLVSQVFSDGTVRSLDVPDLHVRVLSVAAESNVGVDPIGSTLQWPSLPWGIPLILIVFALLFGSAARWNRHPERPNPNPNPTTQAVQLSTSVTAPESLTRWEIDGLDRKLLLKILSSRFSVEELREVCFQLHLFTDDFPKATRNEFARHLIEQMERENRVRELIRAAKELQPHAFDGSIPL